MSAEFRPLLATPEVAHTRLAGYTGQERRAMAVVSERVRLTNLTQHRIEIRAANAGDLPLEIVAFGFRDMDEDEVSSWNLKPWIEHGIVMRECHRRRRGVGRPPFSWLVAAVDHVGRWLALGFEWALRWLTLVLTIALAVGLPAVALGWGPRSLPVVALPRILQWAVIAVASVIPAAFFFLFTRLRLGLLRETFLRQVLFLDPAIRTKPEAATKYEPLLNEVYGTGTGYKFGLSVPVVVATGLIAAGWLLAALPQPRDFPMPPTMRPVVLFGFLGAYFFTLNMILRRYLRADLNPKAYSQVVVRLLTTAVLAMVLSVVFEPAGGIGSSALYAAAFLTGIVPETTLAVLRQALQNVLISKITDDEDMNEKHVVTVLDGINVYDRARLLEEGIESVESLAHANMIELMLRTRIPTARIVDLYDQAILYLHLATDDSRPTESWKKLRGYGIRTASDLIRADEQLKGKPQYDGLLQLLGSAESGVPRLGVIRCVLEDDEWMVYIRHWRATFGCVEVLKTPRQLQGLCRYAATNGARPAATAAINGADGEMHGEA